jgi:hypothetical protein
MLELAEKYHLEILLENTSSSITLTFLSKERAIAARNLIGTNASRIWEQEFLPEDICYEDDFGKILSFRHKLLSAIIFSVTPKQYIC